MVRRILEATGAGRESRVLSLGCGIGDTELLLAPHVASVTGVDLSPAAIRQAREDARLAGLTNVEFVEASASDAGFGEGGFDAGFDAIIGILCIIFPTRNWGSWRGSVREWLKPGGVFYGLDPSRYRLSGALGALLLPRLMRRYQTPDEHELKPAETVRRFREAGLSEFPLLRFLLHAAGRIISFLALGLSAGARPDEVPIRTPFLRAVSSNFETIARKPETFAPVDV